MSVRVPNGSLIHLSSGLATAVTITALTNATEAVATATNSYTAGDIAVVSSGWSALDGRVARVKAPSGTQFTLEGYDTSSTTTYPAAGGAGSAQKVSGWTQLSQVTDISTSGGEQQFETYQFLEGSMQFQIPTVKTAQSIKVSIADDPTLPGFILAEAADIDRVPRVMRLTLPNGTVIYYNVYVTLASTPALSVNKIMTRDVTLSMLSLPKRY